MNNIQIKIADGFSIKMQNALYIPSKTLSLNPSLPGYRTLDFRKDRVLTIEKKSRGTWVPYEFLMPGNVYGRKKIHLKVKIYITNVYGRN